MGTAMFSTHKDLGKKVYETSCASCHGDDGRGDTRAGKMTKTPDLLEVEWKMGTELPQVVKMLEDGIGKMPKYKGKLSDEELKAVSEYTLKLSGKLD
jgi:cbb3-type cytochrome c oxidase subunit III